MCKTFDTIFNDTLWVTTLQMKYNVIVTAIYFRNHNRGWGFGNGKYLMNKKICKLPSKNLRWMVIFSFFWGYLLNMAA